MLVFWTNTLEERARGWLTPAFHATFPRTDVARRCTRATLLHSGYPTLHPLADDFWELFWKLSITEREAEPPPPSTPPLRDPP